MPSDVERRLREVAAKYAKKGKLKRRPNDSLEETKERFIFGTMTNMQKKGSIPSWRTLKRGSKS